MTGTGKGSRRRDSNISDEVVGNNFVNAFGTAYCFNCRKVTNVKKQKGVTTCQTCFLTISMVPNKPPKNKWLKNAITPSELRPIRSPETPKDSKVEKIQGSAPKHQ